MSTIKAAYLTGLYDHELADIFPLHDEITDRAVAEIDLQLCTPGDRDDVILTQNFKGGAAICFIRLTAPRDYGDPCRITLRHGSLSRPNIWRCLMTTPIKSRQASGSAVAAIIAALGFGAAVLTSTPAAAAVFVGFGFGFPIGFPYPYPYYPPPPYYPPAGYYPPPAHSQRAASYQPSRAYAPTGPTAAPSIAYTLRPGWTNAQGQYCREYKSTQDAGNRTTERYGTACRDASGQRRLVN